MKKKKIKVRNVVINHQTRQLEWIKVGMDDSYEVSHIRPNISKIKGSRYKTPTIEVYFKNRPMYPIAYFSSKATRDWAAYIIKNSNNRQTIYLSHQNFFAFNQLTKPQKRKIYNRYDLASLITKKIIQISISLEISERDAINTFCFMYNNCKATKYIILPMHVRMWRLGYSFKYHNTLQLAFDLRMFWSPPKGLPANINPTDFWVLLIKKLYNERI